MHLPKISAGQVLWCQGFSEPEAGSDLAALRTRADKIDGHYVINGSKIWTTYCNHADFIFLLVLILSSRQRGISVLLVPMDTPGIAVREIPSVVGERYFHEVFFTDVSVPLDVLLGEENNGRM
ncbi:MAG: acyl-CoA dehydrogenase family protein [Halioglobus sp.]